MSDDLIDQAARLCHETYYSGTPSAEYFEDDWREVATALHALFAANSEVTGDTSDGYHTFNELYEYRMLYNALLFNEWARRGMYDVHKSARHSDGEECFGGGWFVVVAQLPTGQISNHYKAQYWDLFRVPMRGRAATWDGHTPKVVADRLHDHLLAAHTEPAEMDIECACWPVENPWTYYGIVEPGGALEYNPDCPEHGEAAHTEPASGDGLVEALRTAGMGLRGNKRLVDEFGNLAPTITTWLEDEADRLEAARTDRVRDIRIGRAAWDEAFKAVLNPSSVQYSVDYADLGSRVREAVDAELKRATA